MAFLISISAFRINVTEYFGFIWSRLNLKRTLFAYHITVTTMTRSSQQYCSKQHKLKKFRKVFTIDRSIRAVQNWHLVGAHILRNTKLWGAKCPVKCARVFCAL